MIYPYLLYWGELSGSAVVSKRLQVFRNLTLRALRIT